MSNYQTLQLLGAGAALFAIGGAMVFYDYVRVRAGRPILKDNPAVDFYYITYLVLFALGLTLTAKAIAG